jgi:hypothetical protein
MVMTFDYDKAMKFIREGFSKAFIFERGFYHEKVINCYCRRWKYLHSGNCPYAFETP